MNAKSFLTTCFLLYLLLASLRHRINVDTQGLPAGTYVVKLVDENGKVESRQVVIVR